MVTKRLSEQNQWNQIDPDAQDNRVAIAAILSIIQSRAC